MNYITQIKGFWVAQDVHSLGVEEVGLYFHLLEISNKLNWMNPFKRNNSKIMADLGIKSHKTLSTHRNRLQQAGIITVTTRSGDANVTYQLHDLGKNYQGSGVGSGIGSGVGSGVGSGIVNTNSKPKPKPNSSEANASGPVASSSKKNKKEKVEAAGAEFWAQLVEVWFKFYREGPGKGENPTFDGQAPKSLKKICEWLKKRSEDKGYPWTEAQATDTLTKFLDYAYKQTWLKDNFLLPNLERQFDKIVNQNGTGNNNNKQSPAAGLKQRLADELSSNKGQR